MDGPRRVPKRSGSVSSSQTWGCSKPKLGMAFRPLGHMQGDSGQDKARRPWLQNRECVLLAS